MKNLLLPILFMAMLCSLNTLNATNNVKMVSVIKFGAKGDGKNNDTKAINRAISEASKDAVVVIPAGKYLISTIRLKSNITLQIEDGAELVGSNVVDVYDCYTPMHDMSKYDTGAGTRNANLTSDRRWTKALLLGERVKNVTIRGGGTINGMHVRDSLGEESMRGPHTLLLAECDSVRIEGIKIKCSSNYAVLGYELRNSIFSNLTIEEGWDGIHIRGCENVVIEKCDIKTGDDAIAGGYWHKMLITGSELNSSCNGIRMIEPSVDVEIANSRIYGDGVYPHRTSGDAKRTKTIYGIVLEPGAWGDAPGHTENVYIHDVTIDNLLSPIVYSMGENNTCSGLTIENVTATNISYNTTPLNRQDCVRMWDNITIKNMVVRKGN